ncbi:sensor histidine kinase [Chryseolinea lacunae]|uniref:histidine kinase n=1 Tax=Chryseolinea lacunae TaxID=2801331 RepID=A0ABS1KRW4_9BACT|nr:HAMP domain-containing sensor histidine kinase [Chryseolinea lacunae]MBL0742085.1 HAMP domain-containing histidine kinase [Chryseolinea lacunae]
MKKRTDLLSLALMICSLVLLVVLQVLWLKSSYEKAFFDFKRETNYLFRTTVFTLRDSLLAKRIEPITSSTDTTSLLMGARLRRTMPLPGKDSIHRRVKVLGKDADIQIFVTSADSTHPIGEMLPPLTHKIRSKPGRYNYFIRYGQDTLNIDSLSQHYAMALARAKRPASFTIRHVVVKQPVFPLEERRKNDDDDNRGRPRLFRDTLFSEYVHISPLDRYAAAFPGVPKLLLREIAPQLIFSFFLTCITAGSFFVLYRSMRAQRQLIALKNDFISNITHELKTPVATVSVALEALKSFNAKDNPQLTAEYLDIAQGELKRLSEMTDKIMETSMLESEGRELTAEPFALDVLLEQILTSMKPVLEKRNAKLDYRKEGERFVMTGVAVNVSYLLYNLLDNALKYSAGEPVIAVVLKSEGSLLRLSVQDNGPGIDAAYHKKVFEKFFRVPTGNVHNTKGYGLGLSYVAGVVKKHQGKLELDSAPGAGSTFIITFPTKQ